MLRSAIIAVGLAAITAGAYAGVRHHEFVDFDDVNVILANPDLRPDSLADAVRRAFTANLSGNWVPVTVLSLQATRATSGEAAAGFLLGNVALHALAAALLFLGLARLTRAMWPSAFVAAVFALHPLHVESVAWASMRKDTLSGVAFGLTLWSYVRYVERPTWRRHALVGASILLGLLSKPTFVTVPCVLLLLDLWPLARLSDAAARWRAVREKLVWLAAAGVVSAVTVATQSSSGAMAPADLVPLSQRLANALDAVAFYTTKSFWPTQLAVFYPHPGDALAAARLWATGAGLAAVSALTLAQLRSRPYLLVGWLWFLGMLVPVLGLVQVGNQAHADRYAYLPQIGLCIAVTWGAVSLAGGGRLGRAALALAGGAAVVALATTTHAQLDHWRDSIALHRRAVAVVPGDASSRLRLGEALLRTGEREEATRHIERAAALSPRRGWAYVRLADLRAREGRLDEAVPLYERGLRMEPDDARGHVNLGLALTRLDRTDEARPALERGLELHMASPETSRLFGAQLAAPHTALADALSAAGDLDAAIHHYRVALEADPKRVRAESNLGLVLARAGRFSEARPHLDRALAHDRYDANLQAGMARTFAGLGRTADAIRHFRNALTLQPGWRHAANDLAWLLATTSDAELRDPSGALELIEAVLLADEYQAAMLDTLAAALAASGRFDDAVVAGRRALDVARRDPALANEIRERIALYARGRAYVEPAPAPPDDPGLLASPDGE